MGTPQTWNIGEAEFILECSTLPGKTVDVVKTGGVEMDGAIEVSFADSQVVVKEDATGEYAQFNYLNSKKTDIKIATMHGSRLHQVASSIVVQAQMTSKVTPVVTCAFKDPVLGIRYTFQGGITGQPNIKIQGTLDTVEINLTGVCQANLEAGFDILDKAQTLITQAQGLPSV